MDLQPGLYVFDGDPFNGSGKRRWCLMTVLGNERRGDYVGIAVWEDRLSAWMPWPWNTWFPPEWFTGTWTRVIPDVPPLGKAV